MNNDLEQIIAVRFARAYIGYTIGVSEATITKQIPDDADVGELWLNLARYVLAHMRKTGEDTNAF